MKDKALPVILILIILVAIGFVVKQSKPKQYTYKVTLVDTQAGKIFKKEMVAGKVPEYPADSPYSEGKNSYPVYECMEDGTIFAFVPVYSEDPEAMDPEASMPRCPVCGSFEITVPQIPEGQEAIDVEGEIQIVKPQLK
jgi:hypothetical protein